MLLGNKKKQGEEQNWSIVLNPLRSEIDKKRVARKISEVFNLSFEESQDLVSNTPIILLDNLTRTVASKVKEYFRSTGAEMILTNDIFLKRKCFRTVWPEPPSLSFLHDWSPVKDTQGEQEVLDASEALKEIRMLSGDQTPAAKSPQRPAQPLPDISEKERGRFEKERNDLVGELERLREENQKKQTDIDRLRSEIRGFQNRERSDEENKVFSSGLIQERDREIEELRALLRNAEEKFEGLKEEYRQSRALFESKLEGLTSESVRERNRAEDMTKKTSDLVRMRDDLSVKLEETRQSLEKKLIDAKNAHELVLSEKDNAVKRLEEGRQAERVQWEQEKNEILSDLERVQKESDRKNQLIARLEQEKMDLGEKVVEAEEKLSNVSVSWEEEKQSLEQRLTVTEADVAQWKLKFEESSERYQELERSKTELAASLNEHVKLLQSWRDKYRELNEAYEAVLAEQDDVKSSQQRDRELISDLERKKDLLLNDLNERSKKMNQLELQIMELEKNNEQLELSAQKQNVLIQDQMKHLEMRERELDVVKRQLRELNSQLEQREAAERRIQISNQLGEKEASLKRLVEEQGRVETEIREREESMRRILASQEKLEKELMDAKQSLRHLMEQDKKNKFKVKVQKSTEADPAQTGSF